MLDIIGLLINFCWELLSIPWTFDGFTFKTWHFIFFCIVIALIIKAIKTSMESTGGGGTPK